MHWKKALKHLEDNKDWDAAINFMQQALIEHPNDLNAHLFMNYLLMNLLVEENHDENKHNYYEKLLKRYFDESYEKFYDNPEYLYYTARTAIMSEWYFDISYEKVLEMLHKPATLAPDNPIYKWAYYSSINEKDYKDLEEAIKYAQAVLNPNSEIQQILKTKGSLGEYVLEIMTGWAKRTLGMNWY